MFLILKPLGTTLARSAMKKYTQGLTMTELWAKNLLIKTEEVANVMNLRREAEKVFRQKSENLNKRVMFWSYGTLLGIVLIGLVQFKYMTWFFLQKKIV